MATIPSNSPEIIKEIIAFALHEDLGDGDHSALACVPENAKGVAKLLVKDTGILAGVELTKRIIAQYDPSLEIEVFIEDGVDVKFGDIAFLIKGRSRSILAVERLLLNFMQRMSGIATQTNKIAKIVAETNVILLDTRKTTPCIRYMEKWAVRIGGGKNHRFALYDMIMLKDNHVDYAGGIKNAILQTQEYLSKIGKKLKVEIEVRSLEELDQVLAIGKVDRIMLDNFTPELLKTALSRIPDSYETEASGGITETTILEFAKTGVQYISVGALTHSFKSLDLSLKATFEL